MAAIENQAASRRHESFVSPFPEGLTVMLHVCQGLFLLLDIDDQGYIDVEEFIAGCCRIHGPAKAIDLTTLMCQVRKLHMELREHALWVVDSTIEPAQLEIDPQISCRNPPRGSPRHRRKPSFGLTAHPDHALEEMDRSGRTELEAPEPLASLEHRTGTRSAISSYTSRLFEASN
eukprot:g22754.t1